MKSNAQFEERDLPRSVAKDVATPARSRLPDLTLSQILLLALAANLVGLVLSFRILPTPEDMRICHYWLLMARERGLFQVYSWSDAEVIARWHTVNVDYPPLIFVLHYFGKLLPESFWQLSAHTLPALLYFRVTILAATLALLGVIGRRVTATADRASRVWFLTLVALNPAVYLLGPVLVQWDVIMGLLFVWCGFSIMEGRWKQSAVIAAAFFLLKPTSLLGLPMLAFLLYRELGLKKSLLWSAVFAGAVLLYVFPWQIQSGTDWFSRGFRRALNPAYSEGMPSGINFWWAIFEIVPSTGPHFRTFHRVTGVLFFLGSTLILFAAFLRCNLRRLWLPLSALYFAIAYLCLAGVNEKHVMTIAAPLLIASVSFKMLRWPAVGITVVQLANVLFRHTTGNVFSKSWLVQPQVQAVWTWATLLGLVVITAFLVRFLVKEKNAERPPIPLRP